LLSKYVPDVARDFIVPIVYTGKYKNTTYVVMERAEVLSHKCDRAKHKLAVDFGITASLLTWFDTGYKVLKTTQSYIRNEFRDGKLIRNHILNDERSYFSNEELERINPEILTLIRDFTYYEDEKDRFRSYASKVEESLDNVHYGMASDVHLNNVGIHDNRPKVIDLGCFRVSYVLRFIESETGIDREKIIEETEKELDISLLRHI
jgi:hypothetical protein